MSAQRTPAPRRRPGLIRTMIIAGVPLGVGLAGYLGYAVGQHVAPQNVAAAQRPAPAAWAPAPPTPVVTVPPPTCSVTLTGPHPQHYSMRDGQTLSTPSAQILCADGTVYTEARVPAPSPKPAAAAATRTVKPKDTLWGIAGKVYGNPLQWQRLYGLNRKVIGTNPDLIYAGTVLKLR
ncbi:MAG TPA: LysM peptidoglycan-binding domain-containing protein [Trebonia sp.]